MKTRPILFSGPMVKAILDGRKTQTRRVVKPQPVCEVVSGVWWLQGKNGKWMCDVPSKGMISKCPYGVVGDRLWVRETWGWACGEHGRTDACDRTCVMYRADDNHENGTDDGKWHPSIHMPRWASRIALEITGVRVERVQEISFSDVFAEGAADHRNCYPQEIGYVEGLYAELWDSINAKRGYGWEVNPWVWVVEFKRVER